MQRLQIAFAKISATPTLHSWTQAYNAGSLFALLSFKRREESDSQEPLHAIGKEIIGTLEEEYFTLETKNLSSIKQAVQTINSKIPSSFSNCFILASIVNNVLYVFIKGKGQVLLKRADTVGKILVPQSEEELVCASGFLVDNDIIILENASFEENVSKETLASALNLETIQDSADALAKNIQEKADAGAAIICYKTSDEKPLTEDSQAPPNQAEQEKVIELPHPTRAIFGKFQSLFIAYSSVGKKSLHKAKRIFLGYIRFSPFKWITLFIALAIALFFIISVTVTIQRQKNQKTQEAFNQIFNKAAKKYDEGQNLLTLNRNLARDELEEAEDIIVKGKGQFEKGSEEEKKLTELLDKTIAAIKETEGANVNLQQVSPDSTGMIGYQANNTAYATSKIFAQTKEAMFAAGKDGIDEINKQTGKVQEIIDNSNAWTDIGGFGAYMGNLYLLDKKTNQIYKFIKSNSSYTKATYFPTEEKSMSNAVSLAIDGSIYVLQTDGNVEKFTKGKKETFSLSGLPLPLSSPQKIATDLETQNIYILDPNNNRIVVVNKTGAFQTQYQSPHIKQATDFEVNEKDKTILILSQNKIYKVQMQ